MPGVTLLTDTSDALAQGQDETKAGANPNPYEGMYLAGGYRRGRLRQERQLEVLRRDLQGRDGQGRARPEAVLKVNRRRQGADRPDVQHHQRRLPDGLDVLSRSSPRWAQYLNAENWVAAVNSFGPIVNRGGGPYASLRQGKYDDDDTFQLQQFDSSLPPNGNWKALGDYQNISS